MGIHIEAENYLQINIPRLLGKLTKADKECYGCNICVFAPFGKESKDFSTVSICILNIKLSYKPQILAYIREKFGFEDAWIYKDDDHILDKSGIFGNLNLAYKVPISLVEQLAVLYKITI